MKNTLVYSPIGVIHTPWKKPEGAPIQPAAARGIEGEIILSPEFAEGLADLEGFSHIILLYHFHRSCGYALRVKPFLDDALHGVFATRAPRRPNPVGLSIVRLLSVDGARLRVAGVDMLDGTPLLDIKPYAPALDAPSEAKIGWLAGRTGGVEAARADKRFL